MFPLDVLDGWPRLYGREGFVQYQLVLPRGEELALEMVITRLRASRVPCYLAVLKDFGPATTRRCRSRSTAGRWPSTCRAARRASSP